MTHIKAHTETRNGKLVQVKEHDDKRQAARPTRPSNRQSAKPQAPHQRIAMGQHQDGSHYLRAGSRHDARRVRQAAQDLGVHMEHRQAKARHFGTVGDYHHFHTKDPKQAREVYDHLHSKDMSQEAKAVYGDKETAKAEYAKNENTRGGTKIDVDEARELVPSYKENRTIGAAVIHGDSSEFANKLFDDRMAMPIQHEDEQVLFLAGGGGSGKGTASKKYQLEDAAHTIWDGTMAKWSSAEKKIDQALDSGRNASIAFIYRPVEKAVKGMVGRAHGSGRAVPLDIMADAHKGAIETMQKVIEKYKDNPMVTVAIIDNSGDSLDDVKEIPEGDFESFLKERAYDDSIADRVIKTYNDVKENGYEHEGARKAVSDRIREHLDKSVSSLESRGKGGVANPSRDDAQVEPDGGGNQLRRRDEGKRRSQLSREERNGRSIQKAHVKGHIRVIDGKVIWVHDHETKAKGRPAKLHERTALGQHKTKGHYLRASDADDAATIRRAYEKVTGMGASSWKGQANHLGETGAFEHFRVDNPEEGARVLAELANHQEASEEHQGDLLGMMSDDAADQSKPKSTEEPEDADGLTFRDGLWHITRDGETVPFNAFRHSKDLKVSELAKGDYITSTWFRAPAEVVAVSKKSIRERNIYTGATHRLMKQEWSNREGKEVDITTRKIPEKVMAHALELMKEDAAKTAATPEPIPPKLTAPAAAQKDPEEDLRRHAAILKEVTSLAEAGKPIPGALGDKAAASRRAIYQNHKIEDVDGAAFPYQWTPEEAESEKAKTRKRLDEVKDSLSGADHNRKHTRASATTREANLGKKAALVDALQAHLDRLEKHWPSHEEGPKDGDRNDDGLVFHKGRWHREEEITAMYNEENPDPRPGNYYIAAHDGPKSWLIAGPYATHAQAAALKNKVRDHAEKVDPKAVWMDWGTARQEPDASVKKTPLGTFGAEPPAPPEGTETPTESPETGPHGPIFRQFHHDAAAAIVHLTSLKTGEAIGALHHAAIGDIDLVWGEEGTAEKEFEDGFGLAKIIKKHPEVLPNLQGILESLPLKSKTKNRAVLESENYRSIVRLTFDDAQKAWLLTAMENKKNETGEGTRTDSATLAAGDRPGTGSKLNVVPSREPSKGPIVSARPTGFPDGSWYPVDASTGEVIKDTADGENTKRFKAPEKAREAGLKMLQKRERAEAKAVKEPEGPKEGDRNPEGLVFHDGRWHREDALDAPANDPVNEPRAIEPLTFEAQHELASRIRKGEITPEELVAEWERFKAARPALRAELEGMSKAKMIERLKGTFRIDPKTKMTQAQIVKGVLDSMGDVYQVTGSMMWSPFTETHDQAMDRVIQATTPEQIADYAARVAKAREDRIAQNQSVKKAIENPETLEDFETRARYKAPELTPDQRRRWEEMKADAQRAATAPKAAYVQAVSLGDVAMELHETKHTKTGEDLHVVTLSQRVDRDLYTTLNERAKKLGGWYSSYRGNGAIPGFTFKTPESAMAFMATEQGQVAEPPRAAEEVQAEHQAKVSSKLRGMAEGMIEKADEEISRDRKTNTHKRAEQAASSMAAAEGQRAMAQTMLNLADAIEDGRAKHLGGLKNRAQIEALDSVLGMAKVDRDRADEKVTGKTARWEESRARPANIEDTDHADYPYPTLWSDNFPSMIADLEKCPQPSRVINALKKLQPPGEVPVKFDTPAKVEVFAAMVEKLGQSAAMRYRAKDMKDRLAPFARLQSAGIETPEQLRAALREFIVYKTMKKGEDPIKAAERSLIGAKIPGYFPTPQALGREVVQKADIQPGMKVLEPNGGKGSLIDVMKEAHGHDLDVETIEPINSLRTILEAKGHNLVGRDIMEHNPGEIYDRVIMNPPFEGGQDMEHVRHAFGLLKPGGRLVAITSPAPYFHSTKKAQAFREWLDSMGATYEPNPEGSFKESGTGVSTYTLTIDKPGRAAAGPVTPPETHQIGDTKTEDGITYRLNENHRWEKENNRALDFRSSGAKLGVKEPTVTKPSITYTFPSDAGIPELRGITATGGVPQKYAIDGKLIDVVAFETKINGRPVATRVAGHPDLEQAVADYKSQTEAYKQAGQDAMESAIPGVHALLTLADDASNDEVRYAEAFDRMMEDEGNDGVRPPRPVNSARAEKLAAMLKEFPRAALYLRAKQQNESAHWADNTGKGAAGKKAMEILESGGSIEDAESALQVRREFVD